MTWNDLCLSRELPDWFGRYYLQLVSNNIHTHRPEAKGTVVVANSWVDLG